MASFQTTVVTIAVILLIIIMIFIGISLYRNKKNFQYPPVAANCPDYWLDQSTEGRIVCVDAKNLGKKDCMKKINVSEASWLSEKALCQKKQWANRCELTWDGVTNNNSMVC